MKLVYFGSQVLRITDDGLFVAVPDVLPILGYRDTDALRRRVGEDAIDIHDGKPSVKVRALVALALSRRRKDAEDFGEWLINEFGDEPDRQRWALRQKRLGKVAQRVEHVTFEQLVAAMGVRPDHQAMFRNALRSSSDVVRSVGLPGFSLGGDRFTSDVLVALAARSQANYKAAFTPGQVAALAALSKAVSRGEWIEEQVLVHIREGLDG